MAILDLEYTDMHPFEAELIEIGVQAEGWAMAVDARIKTAENPIGTGPVIYKGTPESSTGEKLTSSQTGGYIRDALFLFCLADRVAVSFLWDIPTGTGAAADTNLEDTITAYMENRGCSIAAMLAKAPEVTP
jgi:hypothetical protein